MNLVRHPEMPAVLINLVIETLPTLKDHFKIDEKGQSNHVELINETVLYLIKKEKLRLSKDGKLPARQCLYIEQMFMSAGDVVLKIFSDMQKNSQDGGCLSIFKPKNAVSADYFDRIKVHAIADTDVSSYQPASHWINNPTSSFALAITLDLSIAFMGVIAITASLIVPSLAMIALLIAGIGALALGFVSGFADIRHALYPADRMADVHKNNLKEFKGGCDDRCLSEGVDAVFKCYSESTVHAFESVEECKAPKHGMQETRVLSV